MLACLVGLGASGYLSVLHWQVHNLPGHVSFCAVSEAVNCDTVALSQHSVIASVPISTWGILFYGWMLVLGVWGWLARRPGWPWALAGLLFAASCGASAYLALVSKLVIQSLCIFCMVLYGVNLAGTLISILGGRRAGLAPAVPASLALLALAGGALGFWLALPRASAAGWPALAVLGGAAVLGAVVLNIKGAAARWATWGRALGRDLRLAFARPLLGGALLLAMLVSIGAVLLIVPRFYPPMLETIAGGTDGLATGLTPAGHPWIGAERPEVSIYEYSDYECPFCRRAHEVVRQLVRANRSWLRLVHLHMPLDQSCNPSITRPFHHNSCNCALASICAAEQGAFWRMNDRLFLRRGGLDKGGLAVLAGNLGMDQEAFRKCMESRQARKVLDENLAEARRLHLRPATPTFRVENRVLLGGRGIMDQGWWQKTVDEFRKREQHTGREASARGVDATGGRGGPDGPQTSPGGRR